MMLMLVCLVMMTPTVVWTHAIDSDPFSQNTDIALGQDISDGTDAIAKFLGFKCPKGYRCLPILECLPCDYGSYKSNEGSDLCQNCPNDCTTLRKGAESWKECVPKCPPGYEDSECGKTCTMCRPGYYKSTWRNRPCTKCPSKSIPSPNMVGMIKMNQCYYGGDDETLSSSSSTSTTKATTPVTPSGENRCSQQHGSCTNDDYTKKRLTLLVGSNCTQFCQCAPAAGSDGTYRWVEQNCGNDTLFDTGLDVPVCNHKSSVRCSVDTTVQPFSTAGTSTQHDQSTSSMSQPPPPPPPPGENRCSQQNGMCTSHDYTVTRLTLLIGSGCTQYCQCAPAEDSDGTNVTYHWVEQNCGIGTLFDTGLDVPVCNHESSVNCSDETTVPPVPTTGTTTLHDQSTSSTSPSPQPGENRCSQQNGMCTSDDYTVTRLTLLIGSGCTQYCQCAPAEDSDGTNVTYHWVEQNCGIETLFDTGLDVPVCNHKSSVNCSDETTVTPVPTTGSTTQHDQSTSSASQPPPPPPPPPPGETNVSTTETPTQHDQSTSATSQSPPPPPPEP